MVCKGDLFLWYVSACVCCSVLVHCMDDDYIHVSTYQVTECALILHRLLYVWEDMRMLVPILHDHTEQAMIFDAIADRLMMVHELITNYITNTKNVYFADMWSTYMQLIECIMTDAYTLVQEHPSIDSARLYEHIIQLNVPVRFE